MKQKQRDIFYLDEIDIRSLIRDLIKNVWMMVLMAISAFLLVTSLHSLTYKPMYTTSAILAVNSKSGNDAYNSLSLTTQMAGVLGEVFQSDVLKRKISEELSVPVEELNGSIQARIIPETNLIELSVTADSSRSAYQILQAALNNYDSVSDYLFSNAVLRVLKEPAVPYFPSNEVSIRRYQMLAMAMGVFLIIAVTVAFSVMRFTVKTVVGAERQLEGRHLGTIPFEKGGQKKKVGQKWKKKAMLITSSLTSAFFRDSIRKIATRLSYHLHHHNSKVLLVTSLSENEGKSCVAANLAYAFQEKGKRVLLWDMDLMKPAQYKIHDITEEQHAVWIEDLLKGTAKLKEALYTEPSTGVSYLLQKTPVQESAQLLSMEYLKRLMKICRDNFDLVILDTPPMALTSTAEGLLDKCDSVVLVVRQDYTDIRMINDAVDQIKKTNAHYAGYVLNAFKTGRTMEKRHHGYAGGGRVDESER